MVSHPSVLEDSEPRSFCVEFGDSSLNFRILAYVNDPTERFATLSDLHFAIDDAFRENNVEIPFPQRDLHVRTVDPATAFRHTSIDTR